MAASTKRAARGVVGLVRLRSGHWGIRWGRAVARDCGTAVIESTGETGDEDAKRVLQRRVGEVFPPSESSQAALVAEKMDTTVSEFLRAYAAGKLPGRNPSRATIELAIHVLLGEQRGFLRFTASKNLLETSSLNAVVVMRWLEMRAAVNASDTIRIALNIVKRLATFAVARGSIAWDAEKQIRSIRPPPAARGRSRGDGIPTVGELHALFDALRPRRSSGVPFDRIAELQLRLGLRRSEVIALEESWLDESAMCVRVPCDDSFRPKDRQSRTIDGVDHATFELARDVVALKREHRVTATGYRQAFRRACARLHAAGMPWRYRSKTQALRAAHATASRIAGVPLSIVALRLGHESERTTERHYLGRDGTVAPGPFSGVPLRATGR